MSKKGIAMETAIGLIMAVVFLVTIVYILLTTGLTGAFKEQFFNLICTFSAHMRALLIQSIMGVWKIMVGLMIVVMLMSGNVVQLGALGAETISQGARLVLKKAVAAGSGGTTGGITQIISGVLAGIGVITIMTYFMISAIISPIPLICPVSTVDVGNVIFPAEAEEFYTTAGARTIDCWNIYGSGGLDPLIGVDPPNPRNCYTLEFHLSDDVDMRTLFDDAKIKFNKTWELGTEDNPRIFLYCKSSILPISGPNQIRDSDYKIDMTKGDVSVPFGHWSDCNLEKNKDYRMYIMFFDKHDYDVLSYGSGTCGGIANWEVPTRDAIFWCVENG